MTKDLDQDAAVVRRPGLMLKHAREKAGISLAHISELTRISLTRLEALEKTDYESLGGAAYVTGYTRAYCKVIDVDAASFVNAIEQDYGLYAAEKSSVEEVMSVTKMPTPLKPKTMLMAVLFAAALLVLGLVWFFSGADQAQSVTPKPSSAIDGEIKTSLIPSLIPTDISSEDALAAPPETLEAVESVTEARVSLSDADEILVDDNAPSEPAVSLIDQVLAGEAALEPAAAPTLASRSVPTPVPPTENIVARSDLPAGTDRLGLKFDDDCWLEIRDATGARIAMLTAKAGDELSYEGEAPFSVILGNARAAEVSLNGSTFDFEPRPGARTLKLAVGSSL